MDEFLASPESFRLSNIPPKVFYIPNFITESEEKHILDQFYRAPKPKWTQLSNRRLQNWGGIPHPRGMIAEPIPDWLRRYVDRIDGLDLMKGNVPNHVLANEYLPSQGIMPHTDGPLFYPTITTVSCGSHTIINFSGRCREEGDEEKHLILLERRSLFIVQESMYEDYMHSIDEVSTDVVTDDIVNLKQCYERFKTGELLERNVRVSLTIRHVPKTTKIKIKI